jgi:hypothetical protein
MLPAPMTAIPPHDSAGPAVRRAARFVLAGALLAFAFTALYVAAFHAPRAKGLDVGVVGTPAQATAVQTQLDLRARGAFDVQRYDREPQARAALLRTEVHGVVVPQAGRIVVAGALGAMPTQLVTDALRGVGGPAPVVYDVRPLPAGDRRGLSSLFAVIGTLIASLVFGVLLSVFARELPARVRWAAVVTRIAVSIA